MKSSVAQLWTTLIITVADFSWIQCLRCDAVLEMPEDYTLSLIELRTMPAQQIVKCLAHLGRKPLEPENANYIWHTIKAYHAGVAHIPDKVLMILHYVTVAVRPKEYENLTLSNIDVIENFGLDYNLNKKQLSAIANRVQKDFAGKGPEKYTVYDLLAMKQILCQFDRSYIERIHPSAYREAALTIGKLNNCGTEAMEGFATLAVQPSAFGLPSGWTLAVVDILGRVADFIPTPIIYRIKLEAKKKADRQNKNEKTTKY